MKNQINLYYKFSDYLKERFGCRVHKITVDAGFSCPNLDGKLSKKGCIFCDNSAFSPAIRENSLSLREQITKGISYAERRYKAKKIIVYFQPYSNTYAPTELLKKQYDTVRDFSAIVGISIGTRPDCIDEEKISLIESYTEDYEVWIEYGLQSIHDKTLRRINRNHTYKDFQNAVAITSNRNIKICAHIILGLPGESINEMLETAKECGRLGIDSVKIHPLYVVKGTALEEMLNLKEYTPLTLPKYAEIASEFLARLNSHMIIQRLTADCPPNILAAPLWINNKDLLIETVKEKMRRDGLYQGCKYSQTE